MALPFAYVVAAKFLLVVLLWAHVCACALWFVTGGAASPDFGLSWAGHAALQQWGHFPGEGDVLLHYCMSLYWALSSALVRLSRSCMVPPARPPTHRRHPGSRHSL